MNKTFKILAIAIAAIVFFGSSGGSAAGQIPQTQASPEEEEVRKFILKGIESSTSTNCSHQELPPLLQMLTS